MSKDKEQQPAAPPSTPPGNGDTFITLDKDALIALLREARRDPQLEAKMEAEAARIAVRRAQMIKIAKQEIQAKKNRQAMCAHRKPNGEETSGGQEFSDGRVRIFCLRCQTILREYWSPEVAKGMAIREKMGELGVTDDDVRRHMNVVGAGNPDASLDADDDFALGVPRGSFAPNLTTENQ